MSCPEQTEYSRVLRVTALLGSTRVLTMLVGLARAKGLAITVGAVGVGFLGVSEVALMFMVYILGLGVSSSSVRFIAIAHQEGGERGAWQVATQVRRISLFLGVIAGLSWLTIWRTISDFTLEYEEASLKWLAPAITLFCYTATNRACIQGIQASRSLAFATFFNAAAISSGIVVAAFAGGREFLLMGYFLGTTLSCIITELLVRRSFPAFEKGPTEEQVAFSLAQLLKLGIGITSGLLASTALLYAVHTLISSSFGLEELGIYLCAFALSGKAIGFILDAMRMDFFPSLSRSSSDPKKSNILISQQLEILILFALPGLLMTGALAPILVPLLYSAEFAPAIPLLQIFVIGAFFRVVGSPLGMLRVSQGKTGLFVVTEYLTNGLSFGCVYVCVLMYGLKGTAWGYLLGNLSQVVLFAIIARHLTGFRFSHQLLKYLTMGMGVIITGYLCIISMPPHLGSMLNILLAILCGCLGLRHMAIRLGENDRLIRKVRTIPVLGKVLQPVPEEQISTTEKCEGL